MNTTEETMLMGKTAGPAVFLSDLLTVKRLIHPSTFTSNLFT
jgi:hypothetical protein